ncbi:hypothetical protein NKH18_45385 [Streptomyces sp. M10(2022)]
MNALEMAFSGIQNSRQDVESMKFNLSSGYKGTDGGAFQELLRKWDSQAEIITRNVRDMIDTLNDTLKHQRHEQSANNDSVQQASNESESVFNALTTG